MAASTSLFMVLTPLTGIKRALNASVLCHDQHHPQLNLSPSRPETILMMMIAPGTVRKRIVRREQPKNTPRKTSESARDRRLQINEKIELSVVVPKVRLFVEVPRGDADQCSDSDISEETPSTATGAPKPIEPPAASEPTPPIANTPGTPPPSTTAVGSSHKRTAKSNQKRIRGKNQYTKDRDENETSPARSVSRDIQRTVEESHPKSPASDTRQHSKTKSAAANRMTMLDMRRRVAAIMEFISRTQVDLAAEAACHSSSSSGEASPQKTPVDGGGNSKEQNGISSEVADGSVTDKEFRNLTCVEMMDVLTRDMVKWQNHFT